MKNPGVSFSSFKEETSREEVGGGRREAGGGNHCWESPFKGRDKSEGTLRDDEEGEMRSETPF
jgi:hypothetical protein